MKKYLIVDPENYDKQEAFEKAIFISKEFYKKNKLALPKEYRIADFNHFGLYEYYPKRISINVKRTRVPVKTPGFSYSFTGHKSDVTVAGVVCHETGHHVENMLGYNKCLEKLAEIKRKESQVTSYEPNIHETFAEMMRLFILNPDLLKKGRPMRYKFITKTLGLKPLHKKRWKSILHNAHPKIVKAANSWIEKGN